MGVDTEAFRETLKRFASGVTIVTVRTGQHLHGMTASSFASVSMDPPLVLVSLSRASRTHSLVTSKGSFAVNILSADQENLAQTFAQQGMKPFDALRHHPGEIDGHPLLDEAIGYLECRVARIIEGGDHDILLGEVFACDSREGTPLLYYDRTYRALKDR